MVTAQISVLFCFYVLLYHSCIPGCITEASSHWNWAHYWNWLL